jgi:hypothetical protein
MSGYYPEGVTGAELEIAGPDSEREETRTVICYGDDCEACGDEQEVEGMKWTYRNDIYFDWTCPSCKREDQEMSTYDPYDEPY